MPDGSFEPKFDSDTNVFYLPNTPLAKARAMRRDLEADARQIQDSVKELARIREDMEVSIDRMSTVRAELAASSELRDMVHERCSAAIETGDINEMVRTRDAMIALLASTQVSKTSDHAG